jgi:hypothetical protein
MTTCDFPSNPEPLNIITTYRGCETAKLDLIGVHNVSRIGIIPLGGYDGIPTSVDEQVKGARFLQERKKGDLMMKGDV